MSIIHVEKRRQYVAISNSTLEDTRLSWAARGLLAYLLSKPNNWQIKVSHLVKQSPVGRDGVYSILRELERAGYLLKSHARTGGKFSGTDWTVYEEPQAENPHQGATSGFTEAENPPHTENPDTAAPYTALPDTAKPYPEIPTLVITDLEQRTEDKQNPPTPPKGEREKKPVAYTDQFEWAWSLYPKREGGNPKPGAFKQWNLRIREGATPDELIAAVGRYAKFISARGKEGTCFVMQAATFFGPGMRWQDDYTISGQQHQSGQEDAGKTDKDAERKRRREILTGGTGWKGAVI